MQYIDWNDAFENGAYIPGAADMPPQWAAQSQAFRDELASRNRITIDAPYGDAPRQRMDILTPEGESRGLVVIVHGGYWHKFDKSTWSFLATACLAHGWSVALPSYRLAPEVSIAEITQDIVDAVVMASTQVEGPIRLTGHSAGGHLVTRLLCDEQLLPDSVVQRLVNVVPISGLYDLRPLMAHDMNQSLQLDLEGAIAESPALQEPLAGVPLTLWVGAVERPEFLRQTRLLCEKWQPTLPDIQAVYEPGKHHFSVIDGLTRTDSALVRCLLQLD